MAESADTYFITVRAHNGRLGPEHFFAAAPCAISRAELTVGGYYALETLIDRAVAVVRAAIEAAERRLVHGKRVADTQARLDIAREVVRDLEAQLVALDVTGQELP